MPESLPVFIPVGGAGTRLGRQGEAPPKAMVEVGERPILWHVMKIYATYGHTDFVLALGYRGDWIRRYFLEYDTMSRPITLTLGASAPVEFHAGQPENNWHVTLFESGPVHTEKGSRLRKARPYIGTQTFFATYGDGVGNIDIDALLAFHRAHGKLATVTGVRPVSQYGVVEVSGEQVSGFRQKPQMDEWINAGFFVFEQGVFDYLPDGEMVHLERETLPRLAAEGQLMMYKHTGFWASMDTFKEAQWLTELWESGRAPWKVW
jgi:glucose-1-phosphate cytidylyltransferase